MELLEDELEDEEDDFPSWVGSDRMVNEVLYCTWFLDKHPMKCIGDRLFTMDGAVEDENEVKSMIFEDLRPHIYRDIAKMVKRSFESLKMMAYSPQLKPQTDRIHVFNGTLMLTDAPDGYGELKPEKEFFLNRLNMAYNPEAPPPETWLKFVEELLEPGDILTLQEFMGYCLIPSNKAQKMLIIVGKLRPFEGHPFQVKDDEEMDRLVYSMLTQGLLTPIVVRPIDNGEYEVISGHRRLRACQKAGIQTVPALIYALDRDEAAIALVDSNLHRERILPSEKAFAYKLKMEALSHQGTSGQVGHKSRDEFSDTDSGRQVQRYIRLTNLIPEILTMVDDGKIALTPAVELSWLTEQEQRNLLETMESEDCTPSLSQAQQLKKLSQSGLLDMDKSLEMLQQPKENQKENLRLDLGEIRRFFPKNYTTERIAKTICSRWKRLGRTADRPSLRCQILVPISPL